MGNLPTMKEGNKATKMIHVTGKLIVSLDEDYIGIMALSGNLKQEESARSPMLVQDHRSSQCSPPEYWERNVRPLSCVAVNRHP